MKKALLVCIVLLLGLVIGFFVSSKKDLSSTLAKPAPTPEQTLAPFSNALSVPQPTYIVSETITTPSSMNEYGVGATLSPESTGGSLAKLFSFSSSPKTFSGSRGTFFSWNEGGKTLMVGGDPLEVAYTSDAPATTPLSSSNLSLYSSAANNFLSSFSSYFGLLKPTLHSTTYINSAGIDPLVVSSPEKATVVLFRYQLLLENSPVLTRSAHTTSATVGITAEGKILSFNSYLFPSFTKTGVALPVLSFSEAKTLLFSGKGALLEFSYGGNEKKENVIVEPSAPPPTSTIDAVQLGYYYLPGTTTLLPTFLFTGRGTDTKTSDALTTITVVYAGK